MAELVTFGEALLRLSPPGTERLESTDTLDLHVAGAELNVAVAASRLGIETTWLSRLPDSPLGHRVIRTLRSHDVTPAVTTDPTGRLGLYYLESAGAPRGSSVIYDRAESTMATATTADLDTAPIENVDCVCTSGITPALSPAMADTTAELLHAAQTAGAETVLDVNYRANLWDATTARGTLTELSTAVDTLIVPERDATTVFQETGDAATIAESLAAGWDCSQVIVTRAADGAVVYTEGEVVSRGAISTETTDPVGTGDAFVGGFLARKLTGGTPSESLAVGTAVAALKRTIPGDMAVITPTEVDRVLAGEDISLRR